MLSETLGNFAPAGSHVLENRLTGWAKPRYNMTTQNCWCSFTIMNPSATMIQASGCSFETSQVIDIFIHYTANASAVTFSDMLYWGRVDAATYGNDHSPPDIMVFGATSTLSFAAQGMVYFVTKNNLLVGGVGFPSAIARTGVR